MHQDDESLYLKLMKERYGDLFVKTKIEDVVDEELEQPYTSCVSKPMSYPVMDGSQICVSVDPELWFSDTPTGRRIAINLCNQCPFQAECLTYALHWSVDGIWGGTTPKQRKQLRRKAKIRPKPLVLDLPQTRTHMSNPITIIGTVTKDVDLK